MLDIGWSEMAVAAVVALIIIGPKDLPRVMRYVGGWAGKAQRMAREFRRSIDDMAREAELDDVKKSVESVAKFSNPAKAIQNTIDPTGSVKEAFAEATKPIAETSEPTAAAPAAADKEAEAEKPAAAGGDAPPKSTAEG